MSDDIRDLIEFELDDDGSLRVVPRRERLYAEDLPRRFNITLWHGETLLYQSSIPGSSEGFAYEAPHGVTITAIRMERT